MSTATVKAPNILKVIVGDYLHETTNEAFAQAMKSVDDGSWGQPAAEPVRPRTGPRVGRNDPCPCGSGAKSKRCCRISS